MAIATLTEVWQAIRALTPGERRQLREWLRDAEDRPAQPEIVATAASHEAGQRAVEQALLAAGKILSIPDRSADVEAFRNWRAVEVEGRPASEILLEERR